MMKDLSMESRVDSLTNKIEARKVQVYYGTNHAICLLYTSRCV